MPETPEIPEASDPFEKRVAVTIAILAVILAILGNKAENARTEAIIKTSKAADAWAFFQAKGIKSNIASAEHELLTTLAPAQSGGGDIAKTAERTKADAERYKSEQEKIKEEAEEAQKEARAMLKISEGCEHGSLALQIAIVLASVSILARSRAFWIVSIILGLIGAVVGGMAFFIAH